MMSNWSVSLQNMSNQFTKQHILASICWKWIFSDWISSLHSILNEVKVTTVFVVVVFVFFPDVLDQDWQNSRNTLSYFGFASSVMAIILIAAAALILVCRNRGKKLQLPWQFYYYNWLSVGRGGGNLQHLCGILKWLWREIMNLV